MRQRAAAAAAREGAGGAAAGAAEREAAARGGGAGGGFLAAVREEISLWQADYAAARDRYNLRGVARLSRKARTWLSQALGSLVHVSGFVSRACFRVCVSGA